MRRFRINIWQLGLLIVIFIILIMVTITYYRQYVPKAQDVESVRLIYQDSIDGNMLVFEEPKNILEIIRIHKALNEGNTSDETDAEGDYGEIEINYALESGRLKTYRFGHVDDVKDKLHSLMESIEYKEQMYSVFNINLEDVQWVKVEADYGSRYKGFEVTDVGMIARLLESAKNQMITLDMNQDLMDIGYMTFYDTDGENMSRVTIYREYEEWPSILGNMPRLLDIYVKPSEVSRIEVLRVSTDQQITIQGEAEIQAILDHMYLYHDNEEEYSITIYFEDESYTPWSAMLKEGNIPEFIQNAF